MKGKPELMSIGGSIGESIGEQRSRIRETIDF